MYPEGGFVGQEKMMYLHVMIELMVPMNQLLELVVIIFFVEVDIPKLAKVHQTFALTFKLTEVAFFESVIKHNTCTIHINLFKSLSGSLKWTAKHPVKFDTQHINFQGASLPFSRYRHLHTKMLYIV